MVAIARLIVHTIIGAAWTVTAIEFFIFKEELRGMDTDTSYLIVYICRT